MSLHCLGTSPAPSQPPLDPPKLQAPNFCLKIVCASGYCDPLGRGEDAADCPSVRAPLGSVPLTVSSLCSQDTFAITAKKAALDVLLPDGSSIEVEILTSDMAERVLEVNITYTPAPEQGGSLV